MIDRIRDRIIPVCVTGGFFFDMAGVSNRIGSGYLITYKIHNPVSEYVLGSPDWKKEIVVQDSVGPLDDDLPDPICNQAGTDNPDYS